MRSFLDNRSPPASDVSSVQQLGLSRRIRAQQLHGSTGRREAPQVTGCVHHGTSTGHRRWRFLLPARRQYAEMRALPAGLDRLALQQDGVVTYRQAISAGLTPEAIRHRLLVGVWQRLVRGSYYLHPGEVPLRSRCRAALLGSSGQAVISHLTAGHLHRLDGLPPVVRVDVTVSPMQPRRSSRLVSRTGRNSRARNGRGRVTRPGRTCLDLARTQSRLVAVRSVESAWQQGHVDRAALVELATRARGWPGVRRLTTALAQADPRSESVLETGGRLVLRDAGLGPDELQLRIHDRDGHLLARADLAWVAPRVVVEFEGLTTRTDRAAFRHDRRRQNALVNSGWLVLRFTWEDVFGRPAYVVQEVRSALAGRSAGTSRAVGGAA